VNEEPQTSYAVQAISAPSARSADEELDRHILANRRRVLRELAAEERLAAQSVKPPPASKVSS
jgi:hypothetical protein